MAAAVLVAAFGLFGWEYYGWVKFFHDARAHSRAGHTSVLWENMRFEITPDLLSRSSFVALVLLAFLIGIGVGIISDVAFIAIIRRMLRWGSELKSFFKIACIVLATLLLAVVLAFGPAGVGFGIASMVFGLHSYEQRYPTEPLSLSIFAQGLQQVGYVASLSNAVAALSSIAFLVLAFAALAHKILWPVLERAVYALQRLGIARHSKLLGSLGIALLGVALGGMPSWLKMIVNQFTG